MLKGNVPDHPFWESHEFRRSVDYLLSDEFENGLSENKYGFPYNLHGFEVPDALSVLANWAQMNLFIYHSGGLMNSSIDVINLKQK
tara:strand:+ start:32 stop:289 length:258 start_codon:yes stop_codon:yes gene_type:complete